MKLSDLGLKSKPQTKYFEGGYISFSTIDGDLYYEVNVITKSMISSVDGGKILNKDHFDMLMKMKSVKEFI